MPALCDDCLAQTRSLSARHREAAIGGGALAAGAVFGAALRASAARGDADTMYKEKKKALDARDEYWRGREREDAELHSNQIKSKIDENAELGRKHHKKTNEMNKHFDVRLGQKESELERVNTENKNMKEEISSLEHELEERDELIRKQSGEYQQIYDKYKLKEEELEHEVQESKKESNK